MGKASLTAYHAERPTSRKSIQSRCRGGRTCKHFDGLPGDQNYARARELGLLGVLVRFASVLRLVDCFADRFRRFGWRSRSVLRG
jgi:hypothetical protein